MDRLCVHLEGNPIYSIILDQSFGGLAAEVEKLGTQRRKLCIVTDSNVADLYLDEVRRLLSPICRQVDSFVFPAGEEQKNLDTVRKLYQVLIQKEYDRNDMLVALGGGVTGDLCGFAAATYLRGISFIQIPTTLLAQVDSSIGGKTGVDFDSYKNMVGAFHMPKLVYTNVKTLLTLPDDQFISGMGEVVKHGLIRNEEYYRWLAENADAIMERKLSLCQKMILESNRIKRDVVEQDPTEKGQRALLNFGHTLGHAIEKKKDFSMAHGCCVAVGFLAAARISQMRGFLTEADMEELRNVMKNFGLPLTVEIPDAAEVLDAVKHDKKMDSGIIKFILLKKVGEAYVDRTVSREEMEAGLDYILARPGK